MRKELIMSDYDFKITETQLLSNNDFIYFKDINLIISKDEFKRNVYLKETQSLFYVGVNKTWLFQSRIETDCIKFMSKLSKVLGSDIL